MTFEEWWHVVWKQYSTTPVLDLALKNLAQSAWQAATAAERERCAKVCEGLAERLYGHARPPYLDCAAAIRSAP